jgi:hypothetical protein
MTGGFLPRAMLALLNAEHIQPGRSLFHWGRFLGFVPKLRKKKRILKIL